jgi:hypothetical protein
MASSTTIPKVMDTTIQDKVRGTLASPHTYPRSGLGYGTHAGGLTAIKGGGPHTVNRMSAQGANFKMPSAKDPIQVGATNSDFQVKAAQAEALEQLKGTEMLEQVKQIALEKYAGDEELANAFVEGFQKEAAGLNWSGLGEQMLTGAAKAVGTGVVGLGMGLGIHGISQQIHNVSNNNLHAEFAEALRHAVATNTVLRQAKKDRIQNYAETIFKFAPHVSTDANLLSAILANAIHGEGIDPQTIRTLVDLESRYKDNSSASGFTPKSYV